MIHGHVDRVRALTVRQPYAQLLVCGQGAHAAHRNRLGKTIENRTWRPPKRLSGWIMIHAGLTVETGTGIDLGGDGLGSLPTGAIVGACYLWGVHVQGEPDPWGVESDPWWTGPVGWLFSRAVRFEVPIACTGAQGLWRPNLRVASACLQEMRHATGVWASGWYDRQREDGKNVCASLKCAHPWTAHNLAGDGECMVPDCGCPIWHWPQGARGAA